MDMDRTQGAVAGFRRGDSRSSHQTVIPRNSNPLVLSMRWSEPNPQNPSTGFRFILLLQGPVENSQHFLGVHFLIRLQFPNGRDRQSERCPKLGFVIGHGWIVDQDEVFLKG